MNGLAITYQDAGRVADALSLIQETVKLRKAAIGPDHPDTLTSMNNLALLYADTGRRDLAISLQEQTVKTQKAALGPDHAMTLQYMGSLASLYRDSGRRDEALRLYEDVIARFKVAIGNDYPVRLIFMNQMAKCLLQMKKFEEARILLVDCLALRQKKAPDDWWVFVTKSQLGQALTGLKEYSQAEPLLLEGHKVLTARKHQIPVRSQRFIGEAGQAVVELYDAWGKKELAAQWRDNLASESSSKP
jgi:tetratricopeptide (TPR) repeat protein